MYAQLSFQMEYMWYYYSQSARASLRQLCSLNGAGDLAVMAVQSPGLIFSGWDSVRAKWIDTTDGGGEFGVH